MLAEYLESEEIFIQLSQWIQSCLSAMRNSDRLWFESYERHAELWNKFPGVIHALNNRR